MAAALAIRLWSIVYGSYGLDVKRSAVDPHGGHTGANDARPSRLTVRRVVSSRSGAARSAHGGPIHQGFRDTATRPGLEARGHDCTSRGMPKGACFPTLVL